MRCGIDWLKHACPPRARQSLEVASCRPTLQTLPGSPTPATDQVLAIKRVLPQSEAEVMAAIEQVCACKKKQGSRAVLVMAVRRNTSSLTELYLQGASQPLLPPTLCNPAPQSRQLPEGSSTSAAYDSFAVESDEDEELAG